MFNHGFGECGLGVDTTTDKVMLNKQRCIACGQPSVIEAPISEWEQASRCLDSTGHMWVDEHVYYVYLNHQHWVDTIAQQSLGG